ncbi:hypothetical protein E4T80_10135 [Muribacter muris]|uniref:Uncharacterized protein n=1 Tax=Muribacter muris TaxID=67855 RepID=A0A4Y9JUX3_9PAST|nr:hypothetical protein [Muribacter muris]MBF0785820.1 hypothetical protein [Muribacter muris]MBF0827077.1 hypothetical protein [Muribacter muris]TFV08520.1 hypothetical protein E4T80_10135 [Muribacter muris]
MKKLNRFYLIFILSIGILIAYALYKKDKAEQCAKAGVENTIYSFIDAMKEDRDDSKKRYDSCNYDERCEIWIIPKTTIEEFADKATDYLNHSKPSFIIDADGDPAQIMEFDTTLFIKSIKGKRLQTFSINEFKYKSVVYEFGSELQLYNQEDFVIKDHKLFMKMKYLGGIYNGPSYRFWDKITQGHNITRIYPLDECKNIIGLYTFDLLVKE